jgi:hypothetical protein
MGEVISLSDRNRASPEPKPKRRKLRAEPEGFLLVPARIMKSLQKFEESVTALAPHVATEHMQKVNWAAYYTVIAVLEHATKYE